METWKSNGFDKQIDNSTHALTPFGIKIIIFAISAYPHARFFETNQCRTGNGKSGKSWNLKISFPRPGKSWKFKVLFGRLVTLDDKARTR